MLHLLSRYEDLQAQCHPIKTEILLSFDGVYYVLPKKGQQHDCNFADPRMLRKYLITVALLELNEKGVWAMQIQKLFVLIF